MAAEILRISIFSIVCTQLLVEMALAQFPEPTTVTAQTPGQRTVHGRIVLKMEQGQLVAAERPDLGAVRTSEWLKAEFDVVNETDDELVLDKIVSQVDRAVPSKGRIKPGESMKVSVKFQTPPRPNAGSGGYFLEFHCADGRTGYVQFTFSHATYVGIGKDYVLVPVPESDQVSEVRFDVPVVIGGKLAEGDFEFSLEGIAGTLESRIDADAKQLRSLIKLDEPMTSDRLQGQIVVLDLASGLIQKTPIVFERQKKLDILPTFLEFIPDETGDNHVAMLYVRNVSQSADEKFNCHVEASILGIPVPCVVSTIEHDMVRCRLKIGNDQFEKLVEAVSPANSEPQKTEPIVAEIRLTAGEFRMTNTIPVAIRGQSAFRGGPRDNLFVIDAIKTGMLARDAMSPFDVYGETTVEREFEGQPRKVSEQTRFRLVFDRQNQIAVYAVETKPDSMAVLRGQDPTGTESVSYYRMIVDGTSLYESMPRGIPRILSSFDQALAGTGIPRPAYWGVTQFPGHDAVPKELERFAIAAADAESKLTLTGVEERMRVTLLIKEGHGALNGVRSWEYRLPEFRPTEMKIKRFSTGSPRSVLEQTIEWDTIQGHDAPVLIHSEFVAIERIDDGGEMKFKLGNGYKDTQLAWLSFAPKLSTETRDKYLVHTVEDIKEFIDEGKQQSKRVAN